MESIFYPFRVLEKVLFVPVSESTGLSEDKASFHRISLHFNDFCICSDSLCGFAIRYNISWILYEICSTSIKSEQHCPTWLQLRDRAAFWACLFWIRVSIDYRRGAKRPFYGVSFALSS